MNEETPEKLQKPTLMDRGKKVVKTAERTATATDNVSNAFSAIKWVAIAVVTLTVAGGAFGVYKVVSAPAKAVGNAAGAVTETVKTGTDKIRQSGSDVMNRLDIPATNQAALNTAAERAFKALTNMAETDPEGMKERIYRRTNFSGHENRVCKLDVDFGAGAIPVSLAADNKAYATAKALGSKDGRLVRLVLTAGNTDIPLRTEWDSETQNWAMRWKGTTIKKDVSDAVVEQRILDVLIAAGKNCK